MARALLSSDTSVWNAPQVTYQGYTRRVKGPTRCVIDTSYSGITLVLLVSRQDGYILGSVDQDKYAPVSGLHVDLVMYASEESYDIPVFVPGFKASDKGVVSTGFDFDIETVDILEKKPPVSKPLDWGLGYRDPSFEVKERLDMREEELARIGKEDFH